MYRIIVLVLGVFLSGCGKQEKVHLSNSKHSGYEVSMHMVDIGFQVDVYTSLKKDGRVQWANKRFDSRDIPEDVREAYKSVEWHRHYILVAPGRATKGKPKISLEDGSLLGYEKSANGVSGAE